MKEAVTPGISLREVTKANLRAVLRLKVAPGQEKLVATNAVSIAQAYFDRERAWFRAIYADDVPVGFCMLDVRPPGDTAGEYYLWRLMIDAAHQGRGYGREAMGLVIEHVRALPNATSLLLSHEPPAGEHAGPFYERLGFTYTGAVDPDGEVYMRLML